MHCLPPMLRGKEKISLSDVYYKYFARTENAEMLAIIPVLIGALHCTVFRSKIQEQSFSLSDVLAASIL